MTDRVLMVRPIEFGFNPETSNNNFYQNNNDENKNKIQSKALVEFDNYVKKLRQNDIDVLVLDDTKTPPTPDSIFPNNWFLTTSDTLTLFPMFAPNRRDEVLKFAKDVENIESEKKLINLTRFTKENKFLEGTGSIVLDRENKKAYATLSPRTDKDLFIMYCNKIGFEPIYFKAYQDGNLIYHTNVMMSVCVGYAIICLESITDENERNRVISHLKDSGKEIVEITLPQVKKFAGNVLEVADKLIMSTTAYESFTPNQLKIVESYNKIIAVDVKTIEYYGGGSARCMIAEL